MKLNEAISILKAAGIDSPEHDAREIFYHFGKISRSTILTKNFELPDEQMKPYIERRAAREPLQYIIGEVGFYRERYKVTPNVLIPREDTEILVDYAVKNIPDGENFIDLCTGSGCIAVSVLKNTKRTLAKAIDLSEKALDVARENALTNGTSERLEFIIGDASSYKPEEKFFAILSNPPYLTSSEYKGSAAEIFHEPRMAFLGGEDGLDFYKKIVPNCKHALKNGGFMAFEIGYLQSDGIIKIAEENDMTAKIIRDLSGNSRLAVLQTKTS